MVFKVKLRRHTQVCVIHLSLQCYNVCDQIHCIFFNLQTTKTISRLTKLQSVQTHKIFIPAAISATVIIITIIYIFPIWFQANVKMSLFSFGNLSSRPLSLHCSSSLQALSSSLLIKPCCSCSRDIQSNAI